MSSTMSSPFLTQPVLTPEELKVDEALARVAEAKKVLEGAVNEADQDAARKLLAEAEVVLVEAKLALAGIIGDPDNLAIAKRELHEAEMFRDYANSLDHDAYCTARNDYEQTDEYLEAKAAVDKYLEAARTAARAAARAEFHCVCSASRVIFCPCKAARACDAAVAEGGNFG